MRDDDSIYTSPVDRYLGDLFGTEYTEKIGKFQKDFVRAKESFDCSVQLEILDAVDSIGECISCIVV